MKGYIKLSIQIGVISISLIALSFLTEMDFWYEYFNFKCDRHETKEFLTHQKGLHYHWNYRGYVYFFTGVIYFLLSVARIVHSTDDSIEKGDFDIKSKESLDN